MKTWEVYKIALENPKAKFRRLSHDYISFIGDEGKLQIVDNPCSYPVANVDEDWELVREPVDFMTAVNSGKRIKHKEWISFHPIDEALEIVSCKDIRVTVQILNENWYIE